MILTDEEKRMLEGAEGRARQKCMEFLVKQCEVSGADRLIDIDGTADFHTPSSSMVKDYEITLEELKELSESGAKFKVPTYANKMPMPGCVPMHGWEHCGIRHQEDPQFHEEHLFDEYLSVYKHMGLLATHTCAIYLTSSFWPSVGQHCSWTESSAVPYCNAILGGRTNLDGHFANCFLGKTPYYGLHITENRYATVLVKSERLINTELEWDVFGFAVGEACGIDVPVLTGTAKPNTSKILRLNSAMNTAGSIMMYHIPGATPEAPTLEFALNGKEPQRTVLISEKDLRDTYNTINYNPTEDVDFVSLGCPNYNIVDVMHVAQKLEGKKCKTRLWVMTAPWLYEAVKSQGFLKIIEDAGATLLTGTCPGPMGGTPDGVKTIAMDSAKQSYYISGMFTDPEKPLHVCYGSQDDCIDAAITGKWRGEWR